MNQSQYNQLFSFIWNIATDVLVYAFEKGEYKKIIMPMMVLRRIDVLLEPTKDKLIAQKKMLDERKIDNQDPVLFNITGYPFYNTSLFTMKTLKSETDPLRLKLNFTDYLNGFSKDVQDIIDKFHLRQMVDNLTEAERLGSIIEKFTDDKINLSNKPVLDDEGRVKLPALDNHTMGTIFEELLRKFNEENNVTEAGEHFTPRDYVKLLADLAVMPVADKITDNTYSIYDGACGTGGILTIAQDRIREIAESKGKKVNVSIYGQELQPETYATCKADLMISGNISRFQYTYNSEYREYIAFDSTISRDGHAGETYDFCISNPPFGTPWKEDLKKRGLGEGDKKKFTDSRFQIDGEDGKEISFIPDISDTQMMFLANNLSRMKTTTELGTRIVEVHNGSSLFTGDAASGASNLRQHIIENDLLEAIVAMPEKDFYNTGIGTFIWVITNRKEERRRGKVQLIDATEIKTPLRKNLGEKNCETTEADRAQILKLLMDFKETPQSKIFPNNEFGYWSVKVCRPLRLKAQITNDRIAACINDKKYKDFQDWLSRLFEETDGKEFLDFNAFIEKAKAATKKHGYKWKKANADALQKYFTEVCPEAEIVYDDNGNPIPDKALEDSEIIPFRYEDGIEGFLKNEILPYTPDAWIDEDSIQTGHELSFTKYFYRPKELRTIAEISKDIRDIEQRTDGMLNEIIGLNSEIANVVTRGLNPDVRMKDSGIPWIGMIPEHWEVKRVASLFTGKVELNSDFSFQHAYKFNYGTLIPKNEDGDIEEYRATYVKYSLIKKDDILINGLNLNYDFVSQRVAIAPEDGIITSAYVVVRPREGTNSHYYNYLFKTMDNMKLFHGIGTGIRLTLSFDELKKQLIIEPPQDEQRAIVAYIENKCAKVNSLITELEAEIDYLKEYKQRLIADCVTGQVNVQIV